MSGREEIKFKVWAILCRRYSDNPVQNQANFNTATW